MRLRLYMTHELLGSELEIHLIALGDNSEKAVKECWKADGLL